MPVQVACPSCQRQLKVPDNLVGKTVRCPGCQGTFTANVEGGGPAADSAPAAPPPIPSSSDAPVSSSRREREEFSERPRHDDDRPRSRDRDDDDDRPSRRSRRRDDDDYDDDRGGRRRSREYQKPHRGTMVLVLGLLGLLMCPLLGIPAMVMGNADLKEMRDGTMDREGEGITQVGRVLGIISLVVLLLQIGAFCLVFMAAAAGG